MAKSLESILREIYNPLVGKTFTAEYERRVEIASTGKYRDVLVVGNKKMKEVIDKIFDELKTKTSNGEKLVWKGIKKSGSKYQLWVKKLGDKALDSGEEYQFKIKKITVFDGMEYKAGVSIEVESLCLMGWNTRLESALRWNHCV